MKERVTILKTNKGFVQLRECPICNYTILESDVGIWRKAPTSPGDSGKVGSCRFCLPTQDQPFTLSAA